LLWEGGRPLLDGWLAELVDLAERSSAAAVLPGDPAAAGGFEVDAAIGPWLLIRRAAFALAGGLDEGYRGGLEVADLAMRLRAMGRRLVYASAGGGSFRAPSQHDAERFQHKWEPWLRGLQSCRPPVTVVMPVFNKVAYTQACLEAYFANTPTGWPELMIVDNASSDETGALLAGLGPEVTVVTNETNRGFARACNQLAAMAGGQYVVFLNNDTLPFPGWLEALVAEAEADAAIGIVGSKLIYPQNGLIQHAGVVLGRGEAPYHVYRNLRVGHGNVNVRRDFDMVTGACLLVRKTMLDAIGGFDEGYVNGYEDVDLCLRARANGWTVRYTPHSILYHFESVSEGRHRFEDENHRRYLRAWSGKFDAKGRLVGR
jgi:GT2 family glycosyltransferase